MADLFERVVPASEPDRPVALRASFRTWAGASAPALPTLASGGLALVLGLVGLGTASFWVDESFTARAVEGSALDLFDGYHGLYYSVELLWSFLAGTSESALRLPSVLGAALSAILLVALGRRLFDPWVGLVAGLLLATNPFVVKWSQQARGYTLMLALGLAATLLLFRAFGRGSRGAWAIYGLSFAVLVVWHPVAGLLLAPAHGVVVFQRRERVLPHGLLAGAIVLAIGVPWAAQIAMRSTGDGVAMDWLTFPTRETAVRALLDVSGIAGLGLLLGLAGVWVLHRRERDQHLAWLVTWAFVPFVLALLVSLVQPIYLDRYLIVAAPAFALLAAVALTWLGRRVGAALGLAVVVATVLGLAQWYSSGSDGNWRGEDWRSAVRTVLDRRAEADAVVVVPWSSAPAARYYGASVEASSTARMIWVLTWSETAQDITAAERAALGFGGHELVERHEFGRRVSAQLWSRP